MRKQNFSGRRSRPCTCHMMKNWGLIRRMRRFCLKRFGTSIIRPGKIFRFSFIIIHCIYTAIRCVSRRTRCWPTCCLRTCSPGRQWRNRLTTLRRSQLTIPLYPRVSSASWLLVWGKKRRHMAISVTRQRWICSIRTIIRVMEFIQPIWAVSIWRLSMALAALR